MSPAATLVGSDFTLRLKLSRYEFDDFDNWHDGNWVVGQVAVELRSDDRFDARVAVTVLTSELAEFATQLRTLVDRLSGTAELVHLEEQVGVTVKLDRGKGTIEGFVARQPFAELEFLDIDTDVTLLTPAAREFEALAREFPVREAGASSS